MIILRKDNHTQHTYSADKAQELIKAGFEVVKGSSLLKEAMKLKKVLKTKKAHIKKK